jgi:hypothetical protein
MRVAGRHGYFRFRANMDRVHRIIQLLHADSEPLKPIGFAQSDGVRADLLRAIVVLLHASFEDLRDRSQNARKDAP